MGPQESENVERLVAQILGSVHENAELKELLLRPEFRPVLALAQVQDILQTKLIVDRMPGGFFAYRAGGKEEILYANRAMARLFGCNTVEEFLALTGHSFRGVVHPEDLEAVEQSIKEQIAASRYDLDYVEYRIVQKDGSIRWVEDYGHFIRGVDEEDLFYVFVADATEKRQKQIEDRAAALEDANRELCRRLNIIEGFRSEYESIFYVDLSEDLLIPYQASGRIRPMDLGQTSCPYSGFVRDYIQRWVHPEDRALMTEATAPETIRKKLEQTRASHINYRVVEDSGVTAYLQLRIAAVGTGGEQTVWGCRSMDEEIASETERREVLEHALRQATAAAEAKTTFLSNMSHDILTPMNTIMACVALAHTAHGDQSKLEKCLDQIEAAGHQLLQLMGNVLELSRLEGDQAKVNEVPCELDGLLNGVAEQVRPRAKSKEISVEVDLSAVRHRAVCADGEKLGQSLLHLASNAVKYTGPGGRVRLSVVEEGVPTRDYAVYRFQVEDNGIGIPAESLERIFEPFERQRNSTLSGVAGMGLGLTIVKSTVELMEGTLTVDSQVDRGSRFTISLTLRLQGDAAQPTSAHATGRYQRHILLVEDNEINRELCAALLEEAGCLVDTAENGQEAVDRIRSAQPGDYDLVLMDIQMPVMDGNAAARAIRALPDPALAAIPIVALSANALEEDRKRSMESGMNAHLAKPIQLDQVIDLMERFLPRGEG